MNGLACINVELTTTCNKTCWMCGRRKIEPEPMDMDFNLVESIAVQLPEGIVVQLHNNGEPTLYPDFGKAVKLFRRQIRCMDTNGKLLVEKADEIIGNMETLTLSTFEKDPEADEQYKLLCEFLKLKKDQPPNVIVRCLGNMDSKRYEDLGLTVARRTLHSPLGSFKYKTPRVLPEIGICIDALHHLAIRANGDVSMCVRFDPNNLGIIGNCKKNSLEEIWNSKLRKHRLDMHITGQRNQVPLCNKCDYWGVAS